MLSFCKEKGISKIIVDTRDQVSKSSITELYDYAEEIINHTIGYKIAIVMDLDEEEIRFIDNVVANRGGFYNTFLTFKEAKRWLVPNETI